MVTGERIARLAARAADVGAASASPAPAVTAWLPDNGRSDRGPGRYRLPGAGAVLVIYAPAAEAPPGRPA